VVAPGSHHLEFTGAGFKTKVRSLRCEGEQPLEVAETLESLPKATLALVLPDHAELHIDGNLVAAAEAGHLALDAGAHRVEVSATGKTPWQTELTLGQGESATLTPFFAPEATAKSPSILVTADSEEPTILIDGKHVDPNSRVTTSIGSHTVNIYAMGRRPFSKVVTLGESESARIDAQLKWRGNTALMVGLSFILLAAGAEGFGLVAHYAGPGSSDPDTWHKVAQGGIYGGAALGAVGLVAIIVGLVQSNSGARVPR
jgi:hypothetical protein